MEEVERGKEKERERERERGACTLCYTIHTSGQ